MTDTADLYNSGSAILPDAPAPLAENWEWCSTAQLCAWLGIEPRTMYHYRSKGIAPVGHRIAKETRFRRRDVESWLRSRQVDGTA